MQGACSHIIKIGGSVIAPNATREAFRHDVVRKIGADIPGGSILVHGSGAYGKPAAVKHGYLNGVVQHELIGEILYVRQQLAELNTLFVNAVLSSGTLAFGISAATIFSNRGSRVRFSGKPVIENCFARQMVPVIYSDFIFYRDDCLRVLSSDEIVYLLSSIYTPMNTVFATNVDGVYRPGSSGASYGQLYRHISWEIMEQAGTGGLHRDPLDVTGGMHDKVIYALRSARYSRNCVILNGYNSERIRAFCAGEEIMGTRVCVGGPL